MWIPYLLPLILGRTFDMKGFQAGIDIFEQSEVQQQKLRVPSYKTTTRCRLVQTEKAARDFLDVGAAVAVAANAGAFGVSVSASFSYMKDTRDREKTTEFICRAQYTTETFLLPDGANPIKNWAARWHEKDLGTHYVQSVTYGGELIASFMFKSKTDQDLSRIKGAVKAGVTIYGIGVEAETKFDKIKNDIKTETTLDVKYYSTSLVDSVPTNFQGFKTVLENFENKARIVNGGLGVPIRVNLEPLSRLSSKALAYLENSATKSVMAEYEDMLDDLMAADKGLRDWVLTLPPLPLADEDKIGRLQQEISDVLDTFHEVGETLDLTKSPAQLDPAINAYRSIGYDIPFKFTVKVRQLKKELWRYS